MFDIGFLELSLLFVIGLLVLGPERLPRVARTLGGYLRKARRTWYSVRSEIERELAAEELKQKVTEPVEELKDSVSASTSGLSDDLNRSAEDFERVRRMAEGEATPTPESKREAEPEPGAKSEPGAKPEGDDEQS